MLDSATSASLPKRFQPHWLPALRLTMNVPVPIPADRSALVEPALALGSTAPVFGLFALQRIR